MLDRSYDLSFLTRSGANLSFLEILKFDVTKHHHHEFRSTLGPRFGHQDQCWEGLEISEIHLIANRKSGTGSSRAVLPLSIKMPSV